jgi:hypothetical protein
MALWQYSMQFSRPGPTATQAMLLTPDQAARLAKLSVFDEDVLYARAGLILPEGKSWSQSIRVFGSGEATHISIFKNDTGGLEIDVRLDVRTIRARLLADILEFAQENGWMVYCLEQEVLMPPDYAVVIDSLACSRSAMFRKDPAGFFSNVRPKTRLA